MHWSYPTKRGEARIYPRDDGRFIASVGGEDLGSYITPEQALGDLVGGHTYTPSWGVDTDELGVPDDLSDWDFR